MTENQIELLFGLVVLSAVLLAGTGRALHIALMRKGGPGRPTTQRRRFGCLMFAVAVSTIPVVYCFVAFGPTDTINGIKEFYEVRPVFGIAGFAVMAIHALTVALSPVLAFYLYARPAAFAHKIGKDQYLLTQDSRFGTAYAPVYNGYGRRTSQEAFRALV